VITLAELASADPTIAGDVEHLACRASKVFSAITLFDGTKRSIVHNHGHAPNRQCSNLAHELAHALLMHPPHPPFGASGQRVYERKIEAEAGWLGPVLLIPNEAARWAVARGMSEEAAADHFGVSQDLVKFRYRMSGAHRISHYQRRTT
jgi:Zn-dependent peptidase ImmA (M78 family)